LTILSLVQLFGFSFFCTTPPPPSGGKGDPPRFSFFCRKHFHLWALGNTSPPLDCCPPQLKVFCSPPRSHIRAPEKPLQKFFSGRGFFLFLGFFNPPKNPQTTPPLPETPLFCALGGFRPGGLGTPPPFPGFLFFPCRPNSPPPSRDPGGAGRSNPRPPPAPAFFCFWGPRQPLESRRSSFSPPLPLRKHVVLFSFSPFFTIFQVVWRFFFSQPPTPPPNPPPTMLGSIVCHIFFGPPPPPFFLWALARPGPVTPPFRVGGGFLA